MSKRKEIASVSCVFLARKMAKVEAVANMTKESYSGFFTVNKTYDSNMFFWFFPSEV